MRTRPTLASAGAAALATALIAGAVTASAAPTTSHPATERYYVSETWHAFTGIPGKGKPTDIYAFQSALTTTAGKKAGLINGYASTFGPRSWPGAYGHRPRRHVDDGLHPQPGEQASRARDQRRHRTVPWRQRDGQVDECGRPRRPRGRQARAAELLMTQSQR